MCKLQLERVDENENPIERFFQRDELLEQYDWLREEIERLGTSRG